jgi:hypothetical protein
VHEKLSYFGVQHTHSMLWNQYWWAYMYQQVGIHVGRCEACDQVKSNFNTLSTQLAFAHYGIRLLANGA